MTATHVQTVTVTNVETAITTVFDIIMVETQTVTNTAPPVSSKAAEKLGRFRRDALSAIDNYPAASVSSACSCLSVRACGRRATTAAAPTETSVNTVTVDATKTETATALATTTLATTVTSSTTATTTVVVEPSGGSTLPTDPFLLTVTDSTGKTGYFRQRASPPSSNLGEIVYTTADAAEAIQFYIDADGFLSYKSPYFNNEPVSAYFGNTWFLLDTTTYRALFTTQAGLLSDSTFFHWTVDPETGALKSNNTQNPVVWQICNLYADGTGHQVLAVGAKVVMNVCEAVTLKMAPIRS
ncbi:hypothetical protein VTI74DRAFT_4732 [Chaetomium olivicolor]